MAKLTQRTLEAVRADQAGSLLREEGNLFGRVRVKSDGTVSISFYYRYRFGERLKDLSCGTWPADSLASIRSIRDEARTRVAEGIDPAVEKKIVRHNQQAEAVVNLAAIEAQRTADLTVHDLFDAWIKDGVRRKDGNAELRRQFGVCALPKIGSIPVKALTEHDLRAVLRALVERGVNPSAVILRNNLTQMFAWARRRQPWRKLLVEGDPMELIEIEKIVSPNYDLDNFRHRVLSDAEVTELHGIFVRRQAEYDAAPNKRVAPQPLEPMTQRAIWIMLSTLTRVGETAMARWEHVDLENGEWFIPKSNVKGNVSDLTIFMSTFTLKQFKQLHAMTGHTAWCFPSRNEESHIDVKSFTKQIRDRQCMFNRKKDGTPAAAMKNRVHDVRCTVNNGHGRLKQPAPVC